LGHLHRAPRDQDLRLAWFAPAPFSTRIKHHPSPPEVASPPHLPTFIFFQSPDQCTRGRDCRQGLSCRPELARSTLALRRPLTKPRRPKLAREGDDGAEKYAPLGRRQQAHLARDNGELPRSCSKKAHKTTAFHPLLLRDASTRRGTCGVRYHLASIEYGDSR